MLKCVLAFCCSKKLLHFWFLLSSFLSLYNYEPQCSVMTLPRFAVGSKMVHLSPHITGDCATAVPLIMPLLNTAQFSVVTL